jgi:peroxiredoxin
MRTIFGVALALSAICGAVALQGVDRVKEITGRLSGLRNVPDDKRGAETKEIALEIRSMPAGARKVGLANSLANLATEGDFGHENLQAVANTLRIALSETPAPMRDGKVAPPYVELASLARYEHVHVEFLDPSYVEANRELDEIEAARHSADFTLNDITGHSWTLSALKGKVVVVNFWATWCPPCRKEMPDMETLYKRFKNEGLVVLAISDETIDKVQPFVSKNDYSYPILLDPGRTVNARFRVDSIPKSFVYDRKGRLVAEAMDMRTKPQMLAMLAKAGLR